MTRWDGCVESCRLTTCNPLSGALYGATKHTNIAGTDTAYGAYFEAILNHTISVLRGAIEAEFLDGIDNSFVHDGHGDTATRGGDLYANISLQRKWMDWSLSE